MGLPKKTQSKAAKTLLALLRDCEGYAEALTSPRKVTWTIKNLTSLLERQPNYVPPGCIRATMLLAKEIPFAPKLTQELTVETVCLLVVNLAYYCQFVGEINPEFFEG